MEILTSKDSDKYAKGLLKNRPHMSLITLYKKLRAHNLGFMGDYVILAVAIRSIAKNTNRKLKRTQINRALNLANIEEDNTDVTRKELIANLEQLQN